MQRPLSVPHLRRSACFRSLTGGSAATFERTLAQRRTPWQAAEPRKTKAGRLWEVGGLADHLLIVLLYEPCYLPQAFICLLWQVDRGVIWLARQRIETRAPGSPPPGG